MEQKRSTLGIASIGINIAVILSICIMVELYQTSAIYINHLPLPIPLNFACMITSPILILVALGLGIKGLTQKNRNRDLSIIGTITSAILFVILLVIYALLSQS